ncbi:unnamed protein product [Clonostachys byssicola]|uniref:Transcription factor domain-containing protein n=1 Tax=Clonostachys byssicola TaxID=160290 RepID=A0A9N9Y3U8_9HYPO|nr:unnamed protein product [Clonostachys byssicola]
MPYASSYPEEGLFSVRSGKVPMRPWYAELWQMKIMQSFPPPLISGEQSTSSTYGLDETNLQDILLLPALSPETLATPEIVSGIESAPSGSRFEDGIVSSHLSSRVRLCKTPITTEHELSTIDDIFKDIFEGMSYGKDRLPLIHSIQAQAGQRAEVLNTVANISQFYLTRTVDTEQVVLDMVNHEVQQLYSKRSTIQREKLSYVEFLSAFQAVVIYSAMRIYSLNHYVNDLVDTIAMTFTQYILRHSMHCLEPEKNVQPENWRKWIQDESTRRSFFALHALNVVSNSRKGFSTTMCHAFPEVPLPYPSHVWEAVSSEAWAFHHRSWDTYCGKPLLGIDLIHWANGKHTGREGHIRAWLTTTGPFGESILTSAKAQLSASFAIRPA